MTFPFGYLCKIFFTFIHYDDGNSETKIQNSFIKVEFANRNRKFKNSS
jgi:hypothetical protein